VARRARVVARAPCRVDLAGGTLDIWPLGLLHSGARTVNVAVSLVATVELERRDRGFRVSQNGVDAEAVSPAELGRDPSTALVAGVAECLELPPFAVRLASQSPQGAGLGGSSALIVALIAAAEELFERTPSSAAERAALGRDLEARMMGLPTGLQDHYPALLGGALELLHRPGGERVRALPIDLDELASTLVVAYTGRSHFSAGQNWQVVRRRLDGEAEVVELFAGIAEAAARLSAALEAGDLAGTGHLMSREWDLRRRLAPGVSTPEIERLLERALAAGAWGGKACGAGGGGSIAVLCPPERRAAVEEALDSEGAELLDARPTARGLEVERLD